MSWFANVALKIGQGFTLPDKVRFMYGRNEAGPERRNIDGWGVWVELPAVVELLDLVADGTLDLGDVRAALAVVGSGMEAKDLSDTEAEYGQVLTPEILRCFGDCPRCLANHDMIRSRRDEAARRRARPLDPQRYSVAVTDSTVHRLTCRAVIRTHRSVHDDDETWFYYEVKDYTHHGSMFELPHAPLTAEEYNRWRAERTGPHGGRKYRLCKICDPQVPLA